MQKRIEMLISEPWNFIGPDGKNLIKERILKQVNDTCVLFEADQPQEIKGIIGNVFVLFPRHSGETLLNLKRYGSVDVGIINPSSQISVDNATATELEANSVFVIIGSIKE